MDRTPTQDLGTPRLVDLSLMEPVSHRILSDKLFEYTNGNSLQHLVLLLDQYNLSANTKDEDGFSLLHVAAFRGYKEIVAFLLEKGASVDIRDNGQHTPLHYAANEGNVDCVKALVARGADINAVNSEKLIVVAQLIPVYVVGGRTALHYAAEQGQLDCVMYLLSKGADPSVKDLDAYTPFHLASLFNRHDVAELLNPFPNSPLVKISREEFQWRWNQDYQNRSRRAAVRHQQTLDGPACCLPCKYLDKVLKDPNNKS